MFGQALTMPAAPRNLSLVSQIFLDIVFLNFGITSHRGQAAMDQRLLILIVVIAVIVVIAAVVISRKRNSQKLKEHFGPEYDRLVQKTGDPRKAEADLAAREKRVHSLSIHPLSSADHDAYAEQWSAVQRRFVDDPPMAVAEADKLVNRVMASRGYPMSDFEQRASDVSVTYPGVVQNYRAAREIVTRHAQGHSSTEDMRQAMVYFRSLFDELLDTQKV
jgi:hypothetical protein